LGEFLQINKRDMTACKPDKAAILSEVVKTVSQPIIHINLTEEQRKTNPPKSFSLSLTHSLIVSL
jgi:hypothetical protein